MDYLSTLENNSIYVIREAYHRFKNPALLWSIGKDSSTLLWLCRKAFFGKIPFPVLHIDTNYKFKEIYTFREHYAKKWGLNLTVAKNTQALKDRIGPQQEKFECCHLLKTKALQDAISQYHFDALLLGIRRDEHGIRAKERVFSPRTQGLKWDYQNQPPEIWNLYQANLQDHQHIRVHPLLSWREIDIWRYIKREKIPITDLYFSKNGLRYRSIGCETCCAPIKSNAKNITAIIKELEKTEISERSGRAQDKEDTYTMQKLRSLGYM